MKRTKKSLALFLMISSIVLLLVLQGLWIVNSYERAYMDLNREANLLLRSTVLALRDSSMSRKIERVPSDSVNFRRTFRDSLPLQLKDPKNIKEIRVSTASSQVQIYVTGTTRPSNDSVKNVLKPLIAKRIMDAEFAAGDKFIIRMGPDSLSLDSLRLHFQKAIDKANISTAFTVKEYSSVPPPLQLRNHRRSFFRDADEHIPPPRPHFFSDSLYTDWVRYNPFHHYSIVLISFQSLLVKAIAPQLFFSLFLTAITIAAFIVLYRNIRSQQRLMEIKNDFISNMTHELKTPISTVSVALEALKNFNGMDNPKLTAEYLDIAQHELNRLTLLTDKVLKTSLFEEHGIRFAPELVVMDKTIEQVLNSMKLVFEKNKASVSFTKTGTDFKMNGGSIHLTNVIYNLLDNALKYSQGAAIIDITLRDDYDKLTLIVKDNGMGIPSEYKDKVFEKFFRIPTGDVHTIKGYGLGLNYVDNVVRSHEGKIEVESKPGEGSTFIIRLPKSKGI